jgi:hypothetical protein
MARESKTSASAELVISELEFGEAQFHILGRSPFVFNRMSEKARMQLLLPRPGRMGAAEKASNIKHDPLQEYRDSVYRYRTDDHPTRLKFPSNALKKAAASAALDIPGAAKTEIGRLLTAQWGDVEIFGRPQLYMAVVRMAGIQKTPDIRTRALLPKWATTITLRYMRPKLNFQSVANLLAAAGMIVGVGDGRQEKGTFSFGQFEIVTEDDPEYLAVLREGREIQDEALANPDFYDDETEDMYRWYYEERKRRGSDSDKPKKRRKAIDTSEGEAAHA